MLNKKISFLSVCVVALIFFGCENDKKDIAAHGSDAQINVLNEKESILYKNYLYDNLVGWVNGEENAVTVINPIILPVLISADDYQRAYDKNEVAADQQFRDKQVMLYGTVKSIDRNIGDNYSIAFNGGENPFINPQALMAEGYTDYLAKLNKGDKVALSCVGNGKTIGFAQVSECMPMKDWASASVELSYNELNSIENLKTTTIGQYVEHVKSIAKHLPDTSSCYNQNPDMGSCIKDISKALEKVTAP